MIFPCGHDFSFYVSIKTSPLDKGPEQALHLPYELLNAPGKGLPFHTARPIKKVRTSLAQFLRPTDDEKVALRAPESKGTVAQERCVRARRLEMFYAGIDRADHKHDVLMLDEAGRKLGAIRVPHMAEGHDKLDAWFLSTLGEQDKEQMARIIEITHGLLIAFLLEHGWPVYPVNPCTVDRKRSASGAKTDPIDAYLLAKTGRSDFADLHRLTPESEKGAELKTLTRDQDSLIQMQTRLVNQLTAWCVNYYPVALQVFSKLHQKSRLHFLHTYPTPQQAMGASREQIAHTLKQAGHTKADIAAAKIFESLHQPHLYASALTTRTKSRLMLALVAQLLPLVEQIADYDEETSRLF
jgi:transposase